MITIRNLGRAYGGQTLFEQVNLQLDAGNRYGVVGANGAGKSTLLRILSGQEPSSTGEVLTPKNARIGVLSQDQFQHEHVPIQDVVMMGDDEVWAARVEQEALLERPEIDEQRFAALEDRIAQKDGYTLASRASTILEGLGIPTALHRSPLRVLSGGFRLRVLLGAVLAGRPDVLLLDEPTNHLDIVSVVWMERFLQDFAGCAVVVSHDQRFLDNICTHILDMDYQRVMLYKGNYTAFHVNKSETRARKEAEIARREAEIAEKKAWIARFKATATKARQANSKAKQLERVELEHLAPSSRRHPTFRFPQRRASGREVLTVKGLWKAYGEKVVLSDASFLITRGERVAVLGPNGAGKSTLLKIVAGVLAQDEGVAGWGHEAAVGYFPQDHRDFIGEAHMNLTEWLWRFCPAEGMGFVRAKLAEVLFGADDVIKDVHSLSGGEAARLILAALSLQQPNVLLLDEPTNHLDLEAIESLAKALESYPGTLLLVSHNRWLVDRLATRILEVTPDSLRDFPGAYAEYLAKQGRDHLDRKVVLKDAREERRAREGDPKPAGRVGASAPVEAPRAAAKPAVKAPPKTPEAPTPEAAPPKKATKAKKPPPKRNKPSQPMWFEEQPDERPEAGSWADFFSKNPGPGPSKR